MKLEIIKKNNDNFVQDVSELFLKIINNDKNMLTKCAGTLFECSYPIIVIDCINKSDYLSLDNLDKAKIVKIKNQCSEKSIIFSLSELEKVILDEDTLKIKVNKVPIQKIKIIE